MTNATIIENNSTSNDTINGENCNATANGDKQNCVVNLNLVQNFNCSQNNNGSNSNATDCQTTTVTDNKKAEDDTQENQIVDNDTVLKYVYKKDDKSEINSKSKGHIMNSLKRRRRSVGSSRNNSPQSSRIKSPAVIVNYETSHTPTEEGSLIRTPNTITGNKLADFSIETRHGNTDRHHEKPSGEIVNKAEKSNINTNRDIDESNEHADYNNPRATSNNGKREHRGGADPDNENRKINQARDGSDEHEDYNNDDRKVYSNNKPGLDADDSKEPRSYKSSKPSRTNDNSDERDVYKNSKTNGENYNSGEREEYQNNKPSHVHNSEEVQDNQIRKSKPRQDISGEAEVYKNNEPSHEHDSSNERENYKNSAHYRGHDNSGENYNNNRNANPVPDNSNEAEEYKNGKPSRGRYNSEEHEEYKNSKLNRGHDNSGEVEYYTNRKPNSVQDNSSEEEEYKNNKVKPEHDNNERADYKNKQIGLAVDSNYSGERVENNPTNNPQNSSPYYNSQETSESSENTQHNPNSVESEENLKTPSHLNKKTTGFNQNEESRETQSLGSYNDRKPELNDRTNLHQETSIKIDGDSNEDKIIPEEKQQNYKSDIKKALPQNKNLEALDPKTAVEILPLTTATPDLVVNKHDTFNPLKNSLNFLNPDAGSYDNKLIHINDGEIKPVIELNSENDSESSEESDKARNSDEADSLESILGVKELENLEDNSKNDKLITQKSTQQGDVKQQFERIPLDYKHDEKNPKDVIEAPKDEATEVTKNEGTLDGVTPEVKYDDNLNIKFDDLTITLPEIKLPKDILAYSIDESPYSDKKQSKQDDASYSKPSYYYNNDDCDGTREHKTKNDDRKDDDGGDDDIPDTRFYDYYGNSEQKLNYKKKGAEEENSEEDDDDEDNDDDLYEKFVRERFGKRGTFQKRSEKLQAGPLNPHLYKTVKSILKKTADIDEQAKKSGDPNANYMWTLEYGEKL